MTSFPLIGRWKHWLAVLMIGLAGLTGLVGCDARGGSEVLPGRVAVVDMARVAQATGFDQRIGQHLQQAQQQEQARLESLQQQLDLPTSAPANPTPEQLQAQQQFRQAIAEAQQRLEMLRMQEMEQFRLTVKPLAERIATGMGYSLVIEMREYLLSVDPTVDITDDIIAAMPSPSGTPGSPGSAPAPGNVPGSIPGNGPMQPGLQPGLPPGGMIPMQPAQPPAAPAGTAPLQSSASHS